MSRPQSNWLLICRHYRLCEPACAHEWKRRHCATRKVLPGRLRLRIAPFGRTGANSRRSPLPRNSDMLLIAPSARVSPLADIEDSSRGTRIVIEDDVVIDAFVKIKP